MKTAVWVFLLLFTVLPLSAFAQKSSAKAALTDNQKEGRRILQQKCAMCHVPATATAKTLGNELSNSSLGGDEDALRQTITNGMGNVMPGFKYTLTSAQIDSVIDFLKTLDSPPRVLSSEHPER